MHIVTSLLDNGVSYSYQGSGVNTLWGVLGYLLFTLIALRPVFAKAGHSGWAALIPIYNLYVLIKIAGLHGATILLYLIPIVDVVFAIVVAVRVGRNFGKGGAFSFFLLWLLPFIGYCIVGYGSARYVGPLRVQA